MVQTKWREILAIRATLMSLPVKVFEKLCFSTIRSDTFNVIARAALGVDKAIQTQSLDKTKSFVRDSY